jgi:hypothetical protein
LKELLLTLSIVQVPADLPPPVTPPALTMCQPTDPDNHPVGPPLSNGQVYAGALFALAMKTGKVLTCN